VGLDDTVYPKLPGWCEGINAPPEHFHMISEIMLWFQHSASVNNLG
jgi:hypothetical protein